MADAAAVILSGIQKLDTWLLQKDLRDDDHARLCSLRSEKKCVLVGMILSAIQKLGRWLLRKADHRNYYARLRSLRLGKKNLVVGMMDVWENDNEMLYSLLVRVADLRDVEGKVDSNKLYSFVGEVEDLWELNCRENLHTLLLEMLDLDPKIDGEKVFSLAVEMADLWKDIKGKLNKEKLYSWLAKKTELWEEDEQFSLLEGMALRNGSNKEDELFGSGEEDELFSLLEGMALRNGSNDEDELFRILDEEEDWKKPVEGVRNDLRLILNKLEDEGSSHSHLHYFMSDAVEMAHDVQLLVHLKESDPIILFLQIQVNNRDFSGSISDCFFHIKPIPEWLQETERRVRKFRADETSNVREELVGPSPTYSESDHHAVGLEEDVEWLLSVLCNDETTICIHGLPGSGKTTLAREFYNHPEIVDGYECRGWVCLSSWKLSRKELLIELIRQLIDSSKRDDMVIQKMENKALQQMLHQHLHHKPYVIILDDVSDETYRLLQYVFRMLPQDERSRLLVTTRSHKIRCSLCGDYKHQMKYLDGDKSWQLLLQTAFFGSGNHGGFPKQLERKGREMLMRKCGGLPLAIKEVGRHWAEKRRSGSEWKELVIEESLMNLELTETLVALESTYLNMHWQVKPCFLRLAFFKEGTIIRYKKLEEILTAGLPDYRSEVGLNRLRKQSIIEDVDAGKTFCINPVFHRLSIAKAVDEIGFEILRKDGSNRASHEPRRHRVIHCSREDKFNYNYSFTNQDEHLVSLFFHGGGGLSDICWKHFARLKVLDMEGLGLKILPETVGDLTELRYLGLRNNYIQKLPQSLRRLKMIEVLDIAQNFMVEVPNILWEMDGLRHLYMSDIICQKPLKIDALMNLETLTYITVDDWTYDVSDMKNKMASLCRLGIEEVDGNSNISRLFASLAELRNLRILILRGFRFRNMPSLDELGLLKNIRELKLEGRLTRLPSATNFPPELRKLVLVNSCLDEDPMPILEELPGLYHLKLQNAYTGHEMVIFSVAFHKICHLVIRELWNLRNIVIFGESLRWSPVIFEIHSCPYLETVPQDIFSRLDRRRSQSLKWH